MAFHKISSWLYVLAGLFFSISLTHTTFQGSVSYTFSFSLNIQRTFRNKVDAYVSFIHLIQHGNIMQTYYPGVCLLLYVLHILSSYL